MSLIEGLVSANYHLDTLRGGQADTEYKPQGLEQKPWKAQLVRSALAGLHEDQEEHLEDFSFEREGYSLVNGGRDPARVSLSIT